MKKGAYWNSQQQGSHGPQEQQLIADIAQRLGQRNSLALEIGEKIAALIALKGGIRYGDQTIEALSKLPEIQCSPKQLRRYWGYYRVSNHYGDTIRTLAGELPASFFYELARLLDGSDEDKSDVTDTRTRKQIEKYVSWKVEQDSTDRYVTVDDFRQEISAGIDKMEKAMDDSAKIPPAKVEGKTRNQRKHSRIGGILSYDDEGLETMASYFTEFATPHHLANSKLNPGRVGHQVNRMADALAALIDFLLTAKETSEIDPTMPVTLKAIANKLNAVMVGEGTHAAKSTASNATNDLAKAS